MEMTLDTRLGRAAQARREGYNCAQAVLLAFPDVTGLPDETVIRVGGALGSGVAAMGEICGVVNALAILEGFRHGSAPSDKAAATKAARIMADRFRSENGTVVCRELKGVPGKYPCNDLIARGVAIFHEHLAE